MKYLITGSSGFIGSNLVKELSKNKKNKIYAFDRKNPVVFASNIKNYKVDLKKRKIFPKVDYVFHLAAFNGTKNFYDKPLKVIEDNLIPTINLINFFKKIKIKRFIFSGSSESIAGAYSKFNYKIPTDEKCPIVLEDIFNPRWSYSNSKSASEQIVALSGVPFLVLRYFNVYGHGQIEHFIPEFLNRIKKKKYEIYGYKNTRTFIYIDDVVKATLKIFKMSKSKNQIINLGGNKEINIYEISKLILKILKIKKKVKKYPAPQGSPLRRKPDISKAVKLIGDFNKTNLISGLKKTIKL
tara:strand:- start:5127 stop:6017 length:891 start_codon:yes stop_codon:yes gene_type:complete